MPGLEVAQYLASRPEEGRAGRRQRDAAADPGEERDAELGFELLHGERERRLRDEDRLGGGGEPPVVDHGNEVAEATGIHLSSLSIGEKTCIGQRIAQRQDAG